MKLTQWHHIFVWRDPIGIHNSNLQNCTRDIWEIEILLSDVHSLLLHRFRCKLLKLIIIL